MTTTIAEPVSRLAETLAAQARHRGHGRLRRRAGRPGRRGDARGRYRRRRPLCPTRSCSTPTVRRPPSHDALTRPGISPGLLPGRRVPLPQHRAQHLPGGTGPGVGPPGCGLVAVSPQRPDGSLNPQDKNRLTFNVVSPIPATRWPKPSASSRLPRTRRAPLNSTSGWISPRSNADGDHRAPHADHDHRRRQPGIRWIDVHPDYTTRSEPAQILAALDNLALR